MTDTKKLILLFSALFGVVFFAMLISFIPGDDIEFTNLPENQADGPSIQKNDPIYGSEDAVLAIYHFGDYSNSASVQVAQTLKEMADENDQIAIVWKDFPNASLDQESFTAAMAARCAQKQDAFWEYQDYLFSYSNSLNDELYQDIAAELGLWEWSFNRCLSKEKTYNMVQENMDEAFDLSITATPTLFINDEQYIGLLTESELEAIIQSILIEITL